MSVLKKIRLVLKACQAGLRAPELRGGRLCQWPLGLAAGSRFDLHKSFSIHAADLRVAPCADDDQHDDNQQNQLEEVTQSVRRWAYTCFLGFANRFDC